MTNGLVRLLTVTCAGIVLAGAGPAIADGPTSSAQKSASQVLTYRNGEEQLTERLGGRSVEVVLRSYSTKTRLAVFQVVVTNNGVNSLDFGPKTVRVVGDNGGWQILDRAEASRERPVWKRVTGAVATGVSTGISAAGAAYAKGTKRPKQVIVQDAEEARRAEVKAQYLTMNTIEAGQINGGLVYARGPEFSEPPKRLSFEAVVDGVALNFAFDVN